MLDSTRRFFSERSVLEVDTPFLTRAASVDAHIDLIPAQSNNETRFLISSPEYAMKRLLSAGLGDIYQLSHVFRLGEIGSKHNPEFTMIEWYRLHFTFTQMIDETVALIQRFLGDLPSSSLTYQQAFMQFAQIDPFTATEQELQEILSSHHIQSSNAETKDDLLNLILGCLIEPHLGKDSLTAITHYPPSQAALARTAMKDQHLAAERFEIYFEGVELANGYHELTDAEEQESRFIAANKERVQLGKEAYPIDCAFLNALKDGMPDCCGVAVGFDRLMMLRHQSKEIARVIPFSWYEA